MRDLSDFFAVESVKYRCDELLKSLPATVELIAAMEARGLDAQYQQYLEEFGERANVDDLASLTAASPRAGAVASLVATRKVCPKLEKLCSMRGRLKNLSYI